MDLEYSKAVGAAIRAAWLARGTTQEQLAAIRIIRETGAMDKLPEKLRRAAIAREENPSASLSELAGMMEPPITKPAMGSRMRRLLELAEEVKA